MPLFPVTLTKDGVQVTLTDKESEELAAIRVPRDEAYRAYDEKWEDLFQRAARRQGIQQRLDVIGVPKITDAAL